MDEIVIIGRGGIDINRLRDLFNHAERTAAPLRFCVDDGALKVKVGGGTWSPPLGSLDPECEVAGRARAVAQLCNHPRLVPRLPCKECSDRPPYRDVMQRARLASGGRGAQAGEPGRFEAAARRETHVNCSHDTSEHVKGGAMICSTPSALGESGLPRSVWDRDHDTRP